MATQPNSDLIASFQAMAPVGIVDIAEGSPDRALLLAWNQRCRLLAEIEAKGSFYDCDDHSPEKMPVFDMLENSIPKIPALTVQGIIAKLWIAMAHKGPVCENAEMRAEADAIRRADFGEVEAMEDRLDFEQEAIFRTNRDLRHWGSGRQDRPVAA